jgi:hypothetical protein
MTNLTDFVPPSVQLPLVLSHDANVNLPIRFKPTTACSDTVDKTSQVIVVSDDPSKPPTGFSQNVSGKEGCPKLTLSPTNLTGAFAFPATVSDPNGTLGCYTDRQVSIGNSGICPLNITAITVNPNVSNAFSVINPTVPVSIGPGAAPVKVTVRFKPVILAGQINNAPDQQTGTLTIASNDPVSADNSAALCGEPTVQSGARILVVDSTTSPVSSVKSLNLNSSGLHPGVNQTLSPAKLVTANNICGNTIKYHLDNELLPPAGTTGNSPNSSYSLSAKQNSTQANMSFTLGQCEVKQVVLQIK